MNTKPALRILLLLTLTGALSSCHTVQKKQQDEKAPEQVQAQPQPAGGKTLIRYQYNKGELTQFCKQAMHDTEKRVNDWLALPDNQRTFANTVEGLEQIAADFSDVTSPLTFMGYVSTVDSIRNESSACESEVNQFTVALFTRREVYEAWKKGVAAGKKGKLSADAKRLVEETAKQFRHNGLELDDAKLTEVRRLKQALAATEAEFAKNLNEATDYEIFTTQELNGVPESVLQRLQKMPDGRLKVTTKTPDYVPVMENAKNPEIRQRLHTTYENRAKDKNIALLEQAIELREKIADLLGFKTWADYRTDGRMAKNALTVMKFLNSLKGKLAQRNKKDLALLMKLKKVMEPGSKELHPWDISFYANQIKKRDYNVDQEVLREYFPANLVVNGVFKVYSTLFGIHFIEVKNANVWHPDVKLFEIRDSKDNHLIGHFYADFTPRDGKYGHAAAFPLVQGRIVNGEYKKPIASIVANFNPPSNGKPSLMSHDEVETFFHEFGHIMHQTLTKAPYQSLAGSNVAQDFVEAPSQMLENWAWNKKILKMVSGYYKDESKKLPDDLMNKLIASRDFNQGYFYTRQLFFGLLDMAYHTAHGHVDTTKTYYDLYKEILGLEPNRKGHFQAGFGHLMGGYDAGYYGYLWSEVYAEAMFDKFEKEGLLSAAAGRDYRHWILEKGDTEDAMDLLIHLLGKKPTADAFYRRLHIK